MKHFVLTVVVVVFAVALGASARLVVAGNLYSGMGFGWGGTQAVPSPTPNGTETGLGWISFNSADCDENGNGFVDARNPLTQKDCGGNDSSTVAYDYGVSIPSGDGDLSGYAWSENFGWISFNAADLTLKSACSPVLAPAHRSGTAITGGARILSIRDNRYSASPWDGCVSLSGVASNGSVYGVSVAPDNIHLQGYAWSSDLGWIDFGGVSITTTPVLSVCQSVIRAHGGFVRKVNGDYLEDIAKGSSVTLKAFYDNTPDDCQGNDITNDPKTLWAKVSGDPNNVFSVSPGRVDVANSDKIPGNGNFATMKVFYGPQSVELGIRIPCNLDCSPEDANHCDGEHFSKPDECGNPNDCIGTRVCNYNWKEIKP